ncbi:MAG: hypothetical protein NW220_09485 [Leptolyngbyaceae cyanobacterium bins.349]|nr:hypothetical protein [Leptolyngbyaceae cyanobacterium bins.349]
MAWLKFLNRNIGQEQPTSAPSDTSTAATPNAPKQPATTVMQVVAEETIMAVAQWLVNLVNHTIQPQPVTPTEPTPESVTPPQTTTEALLSKFSTLIEQLSDRDQKLFPLDQRLQKVEAAFTREEVLERQLREAMQLIDRLSQRLIRVEDLAGRVNVFEVDGLIEQNQQFAQRLHQSNDAIALFDLRLMQLESQLHPHHSLSEKVIQLQQSMTLLDQRVDRLENSLARFGVLSKVVEGNRAAIVAMPHVFED